MGTEAARAARGGGRAAARRIPGSRRHGRLGPPRFTVSLSKRKTRAEPRRLGDFLPPPAAAACPPRLPARLGGARETVLPRGHTGPPGATSGRLGRGPTAGCAVLPDPRRLQARGHPAGAHRPPLPRPPHLLPGSPPAPTRKGSNFPPAGTVGIRRGCRAKGGARGAEASGCLDPLHRPPRPWKPAPSATRSMTLTRGVP